ncbi:hypothetical protein RhiirA1_420164 [Rhizophagus irregularis]|uniref:Uncharacterized protein n=2 Tax=Rhizophagus irregularis TaxID=588596 RepID=U9UM82_RHIID|nr:hypothetical protein GLOIN_2v1629250 [Rhizophagus irregularis DAOM 181602=DAOM 197198]PKC65680.1 hypothetical protein RhiirA1_420164 [Rhizophagus irregularis]PKK64841.1 hypothetical protein RhiirC2_756005 [Rhizophagus irregularis]PKY18735.1 hypothetical protein RhiirB3_405936 [Rhizophagus irregularis]POG69244.1 hypothetical protein GLOIN_2v1629250 [Rhizophagus irregularis DAOM 181602=DAOM 197198]GBC37195.1 hypothetical protein GLOIN_2v1629250 [Rhizophagus irregularis DAOM 181602=DAOM 197198|eukprot:XP_025176110.1 hypothetical protein GLOIN_2v1629250 [Rhizophagus irregularis DAOM 181602=DAOM 197198]
MTLQCHMFDVREIIDGKPPLTLNPIYYEDSDTLKIYFVDYMSPTSTLQNNYVETKLRMSKWNGIIRVELFVFCFVMPK